MSVLAIETSPLETREERVAAALQHAVGDIATAHSVEESDTIFEEITGTLGEEFGRPPARHENMMLEDFMAEPKKWLVDEVSFLAGIYGDRSVTYNRPGQVITEFVTGNAVTDTVDSRFRLITTASDKKLVTVRTHLQGMLEDPCTIQVANDKLSVSLPIYKRGMVHDVELGLAPGQQGDLYLRGVFASTIWAARERMRRRPEEQAAFDARAMQHLIADIKERCGVIDLPR